ncbi:MAG: orotidine 5'-phosphate decarboxylase [Bacteroidetes bacterium GWE2_29_8]|nr:MAG: orotidine 5'-phosphate decarboxylase [Bacteroidetes bacterium GWE2_29_8]OFY23769.1 MAG: orotidine 5'-phosphate decarboxylase [Bacteroidetes bacterium GWF2_29_10]
MKKEDIIKQINIKKTFLCVGLDTDIEKIPTFLLDYEDPIFEFNKRIIDATQNYCISYKLNLAFYESQGIKGWESLAKTVNYIPKDIFKIADAKRGDIGNTSKMYAKAIFEHFSFDAITVSPYMGSDSISPFLEYSNKWVIILGLTSNKGADDFQLIKDNKGKHLFENVIETSQRWGTQENIMYVVGATKTEYLEKIRNIIPDNFLLIPGVGKQGGNLEDVFKYGANKDCGLIVNSSRDIIYASNDQTFAEEAKKKAKEISSSMALLME